MFKKLYLFLTLLTAFLFIGSGTMWGDELTVANSTNTNSNVPVWGNWCDADTRNQVIYPASLLTSMQNKNITSMTFYLSSSAAEAWTSTFTIGLAEVEESAIAGSGGYWATYYYNSAATTTVYTGTLDGTGSTIVVTFSEPFSYTDGNLLFNLTSIAGNYKDATFYGENQSGNVHVASHGSTTATSSSTGGTFLPKTTFTYTTAAPVTCPKPTELEYSNVTATSVDLDWTNGGTESSWNVLYKASGDADWSSTVASEHPYTLSGLTPNSNYQVKVQAVCGVGDESSASNVVSFPTPCANLTLPWTLDLSTATNNTILDCWDISGSTSTTASGSSKYYVWGVYKYGGNDMLRMCNYNVAPSTGSIALINTPNIDVPNDGKEYQLVFNYSHTASCGAFKVLISENGGSSFSDFSPVASYTKVGSTTSYTEPEAIDDNEAVISLAGYNNKTIMLQFYANANYGTGAIFLKNIRIVEASSCTKPTGLSYANVTTNSVDLSWTAGASETAWNVRYMADGDADWTVIPANDNDGFTVSGLSDNTHYTMQVQADCGSEVVSEWNSTAIDFTTKCNAFAMPFTQTFDGLIAGIPDCWDNSEGTTDNDAYKWNYYATGYSGKCVRFEALYNATNNDNYLKTPSITVSEAAQLSFRYKNPKGAALSVYYSIDGGEKESWLTSLETKTTWSDLVVEDLPAACEGHSVVIMFKGVSNCSYGDAYIYLDEVQVKAVPTCITPTGLGYSAVTAEGATLSWTAGASETAWKVQYSEDNSSWSEAVDATSNPFVLTGLDDNTLYYVRVAANCGESVSDYTSATVSFTTKCAAITSFPWSEDFQGETNETNIVCWDNSASTCFTNPAGSTPSKYVWGVIRTGSYGDYNYQLYMRNFNVRAGTALINTPSFTLPSDKDMQLVFNYSHLASCDPLVVKVSVNGGEFSAIDGASYSNDPAGTYSYSNPGTYKEATIDLSAHRGKTIILQFFTTANYGEGAIWLDNVRIEAAPTCFKPQNLSAASSITPDGATFSWSASGHGESTYQWAVAAGSDAPAWVDDDAHKVNATSKTVTGLAAGTYKFYVRSYCDSEDQSDAAVSASFTTATVAAPTIGTITTTNNSANVSWSAPEVSYSVQYQWKTNETSWSEPTSDLSVAINSLSANTTYTFYVRSYFSASSQSSSVSKQFTTDCNPITVSSEYSETFDDINSGIPSCWKNNEGTTTTDSYKWNSAASGQSGRCVRFESKNNQSGKTNILASPIFTITSDADLTFFVKNYKGGAYDVKISVNGGERQTLFTGLTNIQNWTKKEAALTDHIGKTVQFFFCATSNYSESNDGYLYLDEFQIVPVSCRKPASDPVVSSKDATTATLTWTAGGTNTDYQFCLAPAGTAEGDLVWDENNVVSALTTSFDDLEPVHSYDFYVRTYCDELNQSDARMVSFRTSCGIFSAPFEENFNGQTAHGNDGIAPECWDNSASTMETLSYLWQVVNYSGRNGSKCLRCGSMADEEKTNIIVSPEIRLGAGKQLLTFWCKKPEADNFVVKVTKDNGANFTTLLDLSEAVIADWTLKFAEIPDEFSSQVVKFYFCNTAVDQGSYIYIDDVRVARGEFFDDAANSGVEDRINALALVDEKIDFVMNRPMQFNGAYNTLCLPFDVSAEDMADSDHPLYNNTVKVFDYATIGDNELQLAIRGASSIEAGVPCFVKYDGAAGDPRSAFLFKEVTIKAGLTPTVDGDASYEGIYEPIAVTAETDNGPHHIIFVGADNQLYWPGVARTMRGFRAYFHIDANSLNGNPIKPGMPARMVEHHNTPTDIKNINAENGAVIKRLENNQVVIIRNGVKYNIQGQVISK